MLPQYEDLHALTPDPPKWYDVNGVPRWKEYELGDTNIYANHGVMYESICQACKRVFHVVEEFDNMTMWDKLFTEACLDGNEPDQIKVELPTIDEIVSDLRYGDPPNHGCVGDTMGSFSGKTIVVFSRGTDENNHLVGSHVPHLEGVFIEKTPIEDTGL